MRSVRKKYDEMRKRRARDKFEFEFNKGVPSIVRILTDTLKRFEADGLIVRNDHPDDSADQVRYVLAHL